MDTMLEIRKAINSIEPMPDAQGLCKPTHDIKLFINQLSRQRSTDPHERYFCHSQNYKMWPRLCKQDVRMF